MVVVKQNLNSKEKIAKALQGKKLTGDDIMQYPKFVFNLCIVLPLFLIFLVPIVIVYLIYKKFLGAKPKRSKPTYLDVSEAAKNLTQKNDRQFDLVMFGATGFTGKLCVEYLAQNYATGVKWAMAGRSQKRLEAIKNDLVKIEPKLANLTILIADSSKPEELRNIVNQTRTVISTVGPYEKYGTNLVALCAQYGTHYADITGEVAWVRQMIQQYDNIAAKTGAIIINCCGCDSIPWDILCFKLAEKLKNQQTSEKLKTVTCNDYMYGNMSGGTFATLLNSLANPPPKSTLGYDPLLKKTGADEKIGLSFKPVIQRFLGYDAKIKKFVGMWALADGNAGIVKRSCALLGYNLEGERFTYKESLVYANFFTGFNIQIGFLVMGGLIACPPLMNAIQKYVFPQPGEGPSKVEMDKGFATIKGLGVGSEGTKVTGTFTTPNDPGYADTARMLVETGLGLSLNAVDHPSKGGFQTPSSGLGNVLVKRLTDSGTYIEIDA